MAKLSIFLFLLTGILSCSSHHVTKETIVRTLNEIIASDSLSFSFISASLSRLELPDSVSKKFFKDDHAFVLHQQNDTTNLTLGKAVLMTYRRKSNDFKPALVDSSFGGRIYYVFSKPLFSSDGQTVAISMEEVCNCMLGGWGKKIIYRKQGGIWRRVATWDSWIS